MLNINEVGEVHDRINQLVDYFCQGNKAAFGRRADIQSGVLAGIVGGRKNKPSFEVMQRLLTAYPNVSPTWLLFGHGPMVQQTHGDVTKPKVMSISLIALEAELGTASEELNYWRERLRYTEKAHNLIIEELSNAEAALEKEQAKSQRNEEMLAHEQHRVAFATQMIQNTQPLLEAAQEEVRKLRTRTLGLHREIAQTMEDEANGEHK
ncbi:MAG: hypothetical protein EOO60_05435 [Hymenobacter sp.]|nr:MAG: hypothetical protein EOO60_05435 [Hymenobacter sp.]